MLFNWKLFPGTNLQDLNLDWIINFVKMIPSRLPKFSDHHTWLVYDYSTGEYYDSGEPTGGAGEPGEPGKSPIIGVNGNWYIWNNDVQGYVDTGTRAQGVQGEPGAGVVSGGVAGDVLVKASGVDYDTGWTATPPQMGSLAHINAGNTADRIYNKGEYLVYNGLLYKVTDTTISEGVTLNPNSGGNIKTTTVGENITLIDLSAQITGESSVGTLSGVSCKKRGNIVSFNLQFDITSDIAQYGYIAYNLPPQIAGADIIYGFLISSNTMIPLYLRSGTSLATRVSTTARGSLIVSATYMTTDN